MSSVVIWYSGCLDGPHTYDVLRTASKIFFSRCSRLRARTKWPGSSKSSGAAVLSTEIPAVAPQ